MCVHFDLQSGPREHAVDWYKSDTGTECDNKELKFDIDEKKIPQEFSFKLSFFFFYSLVKPPFLVLFKDTFAVNYSWQRSNSILWGVWGCGMKHSFPTCVALAGRISCYRSGTGSLISSL